MISDTEAEIPDSLNNIELFSAANYLKIDFLEKQLAELIKHNINKVKVSNCDEILTTYNFFHNNNSTYSKEISDLCLIVLFECLDVLELLPKSKLDTLMTPTKLERLNQLMNGVAFYLRGNTTEAINSYKENYKKHNNLHLIFLGYAYIKAHQYDQALNLVKENLEDHPNNFYAYLLSAHINLAQKALPQALANLDHAITVQPNNAFAFSEKRKAIYSAKELPSSLG